MDEAKLKLKDASVRLRSYLKSRWYNDFVIGVGDNFIAVYFEEIYKQIPPVTEWEGYPVKWYPGGLPRIGY